jgi:hypothetical protein
MKGQSGFKMLFTCANTDGKSLIQCKLRLLKTASKEFASYGSSSDVDRTSRTMSISLLKGKSASRYKSASEESAAVMVPIRFDRGPLSGASSEGKVSARDRLHAFAPRSRTLGK